MGAQAEGVVEEEDPIQEGEGVVEKTTSRVDQSVGRDDIRP